MANRTASTPTLNTPIAGIPETLSFSNACKALDCSRQTLYRKINAGELRVYKIGKRKILVNADDVRSFFAQPSNYRVID